MKIEIISKKGEQGYVLNVSSNPYQVGDGRGYLYYAIPMETISTVDRIRWKESFFYNPLLDQLQFPVSEFDLK